MEVGRSQGFKYKKGMTKRYLKKILKKWVIEKSIENKKKYEEEKEKNI